MTLRDVALHAGVSHMTVSNVVNARPGVVQEETRRRVLTAMQELDYHPSSVARAFSRRHMDTLGVVLPHGYVSPFSHSYFSPILDGIAEVALRAQQNLTLFTGHIWMGSERSLAAYRDDRCDGLLLLTPSCTSNIVPELHRVGVKFVVIGDALADDAPAGVYGVSINDRAAQRELTACVLRAGHRRIAMLLGNAEVGSVHLRLLGHLDALADWGVPSDPSLILRGEFIEPTISERIALILAVPKTQRPTAIICTNDDMALIAMRVLRDRGVRVPDDLSVIGFDDIPGAAIAQPALTTVRQPIRELGIRAAETLLDFIHEVPQNPNRILLPTAVIIRASLAPPSYLPV